MLPLEVRTQRRLQWVEEKGFLWNQTLVCKSIVCPLMQRTEGEMLFVVFFRNVVTLDALCLHRHIKAAAHATARGRSTHLSDSLCHCLTSVRSGNPCSVYLFLKEPVVLGATCLPAHLQGSYTCHS